MKSKKIVTNYSYINEYTRNKIDLDIDKVSKCISVLEDFIFNYKKEELIQQKELLDKLINLKRFN